MLTIVTTIENVEAVGVVFILMEQIKLEGCFVTWANTFHWKYFNEYFNSLIIFCRSMSLYYLS